MEFMKKERRDGVGSNANHSVKGSFKAHVRRQAKYARLAQNKADMRRQQREQEMDEYFAPVDRADERKMQRDNKKSQKNEMIAIKKQQKRERVNEDQ